MHRKTTSNQLTLDQARTPDGKHGGWRPGAGRPRGRTKCAHLAREPFASRYPQHVTLRLADDVGSIRREAAMDVIRDAIAKGGDRDDFRVIHFNVLGNHLHLITEAANESRLGRGMQGLMVRLARGINKTLGRTGRVFKERYHVRVLRSPREVRNAIRYVLLNGRHHAAERGQRLNRDWIDPYSSALWFDGWMTTPATDAPWLRRLRRMPCPTAAAKTWLLNEGWRRHGLLRIDEVPGA